MNYTALISTCDIGLLQLLLWGLIPFILGWLLRHLMGGGNDNNHDEEIASLRRQLADSKGKPSVDSSVINQYKADLSARDREISSLTSSLAAAQGGNKNEARRIRELESQRDELKEQLNECSEKRAFLQEQNDDLYAEIKSHVAAKPEVKTDEEDEGPDLEQQLESLGKENGKLKGKVKRLETDLHAARLVASRNSGGGKEKLNQEIEELKKQLAGARAAQANAERMAEEARATQPEAIVTPIAAAPEPTTAPAPTVDDLTKIEGVGPKTKELFAGQGITSFKQVAGMNEDSLKAALAEGGDRFRILDPYTWPRQAELILKGDQAEIDAYQDYLIAGRDPARYAAQFNPEDLDLDAAKEVFGKAVKLNDLKIVEGIGPKIESLLNENSVNTWVELSSTSREILRKLVDDNGYAYMSPESWPKQAAMLASGKWAELKKWQDEHDHGKE